MRIIKMISLLFLTAFLTIESIYFDYFLKYCAKQIKMDDDAWAGFIMFLSLLNIMLVIHVLDYFLNTFFKKKSIKVVYNNDGKASHLEME